MFNRIIRDGGLLGGGVFALTCFVLGVLALSLSGPMAAACGPGGCNTPGGMTSTCAITGGGFVTVNCTGPICPSGRACGKCDVFNSQGDVVSCGCECVGCSNCGLGDDPGGGL